jgi:large subunit ribosomal protein L25
MANNQLNAALRSDTGKGAARQLRASGRVPAVIYGHGEKTRSLSVDAHELERLFSGISIESTVINVKIKGQRAPVNALVREVQRHPYRADVLHVDFYQVHAGEEVSLEVPLRVTGTPVGVREGGVLQQALHELSISCVPAAIPEAIEIDVSGLEVNESVHVKDLVLPEGVTVDTDEDQTVCSVVAPTVAVVEEEEAEVLEEAEAEPEVIGKGPEAGAEPSPETEES